MRWLMKLFRHRPSPLELARQERAAAYRAYCDARARHDSRSVHHALSAFRRATTEVVRLELTS